MPTNTKLKITEKNDKKALQKLLDKRDEELHTKLQRTKGYAELVKMKAAANLLLEAVHRDMTKLVKRHDPEADVSAVIYGVTRDVDAAGFEYGHLFTLL
jgi:Xaa-Pro aminopeptidase